MSSSREVVSGVMVSVVVWWWLSVRYRKSRRSQLMLALGARRANYKIINIRHNILFQIICQHRAPVSWCTAGHDEFQQINLCKIIAMVMSSVTSEPSCLP